MENGTLTIPHSVPLWPDLELHALAACPRHSLLAASCLSARHVMQTSTGQAGGDVVSDRGRLVTSQRVPERIFNGIKALRRCSHCRTVNHCIVVTLRLAFCIFSPKTERKSPRGAAIASARCHQSTPSTASLCSASSLLPQRPPPPLSPPPTQRPTKKKLSVVTV